MLITALLMTGALLHGEPDGVVATAPRTAVDLGATARPVAPSVEGAAQAGVPHNLTTDEQIDRWLASRSTDDAPYPRDLGPAADDRKPHGEVSVGVGTGGYRDYAAAVTLPLGENGRLSLSYRQVENGYPLGYGYGYGYGYGQGFGHGYGRGHGLTPFEGGGYGPSGARRSDAAIEFDSRLMGPATFARPAAGESLLTP